MHAAGQHVLHALAHHGAMMDIVDKLQVRAADRFDNIERERRADEIHCCEQLGIERFENQRDAGILRQLRRTLQNGYRVGEMLVLRHSLHPETGCDDQRRAADLLCLGQRVGHGTQHFVMLRRVHDGPSRIDAETGQRHAGFFHGGGDACHVLVTPEVELGERETCRFCSTNAFRQAIACFLKLPLDTGGEVGQYDSP